jgi:hypothetical protein
MIYERVELEVDGSVDSSDGYDFQQNRVVVTAYFTMHNNGNAPESMQAIFPLESFTNCESGVGMGNSYTYYSVNQDSFEVMIDGNIVPIKKVVTAHPHQGCEHMTWAGFDITFPVDEDVVIRVNYVMESLGVDDMQNIEYILETGAGWAGPIQRGYVVIKFPYTATTENVLSESTPGYQFLYNEIFWSFENLEPTSDDNIQISILSPGTWQEILSLRRNLEENPALPDKWLKLAQIYFDISTWHYSNVRNAFYYQKIANTYEQGITSNPDNASLYSNYAQFKIYDWSPYLIGQLPDDEASQILLLLNKALSLDPNDEVATQILSDLMYAAPFITFTPPATIPPTVTSQFTATASITPSATITPIPSGTALVVTVVHTKIVKAPTSTQELDPALTIFPSLTPSPVESPRESNSSSMILIALGIFVLGAGSGWFLSNRQRK